MRILVLAGVLAIAGCGSLKIPDKVAIATAVACIDEETRAELEQACSGRRSDEEILELDDYKVVQAVRADRGRAAECIDKQRAAIAACSKVPEGPKTSSGGPSPE